MDDIWFKVAVMAERMQPWRGVTQAVGDFYRADGWGRLLSFPGVVATVANATLQNMPGNGGWFGLLGRGWREGEWLDPIGSWLTSELDADPSVESATIRIHDETYVLYWGVGLVARVDRDATRLLFSPDLSPLRAWVDGWVLARVPSGGGRHVVRLVAPRGGSSGASFDRPSRGGGQWEVSVEPVTDGGLVSGPWSPTADAIRVALTGGRTVLLFGPPGTGKTQTAVRAAEGRVLVVPGTSFGRHAWRGRDAAEVASLFGATSMVVDDIPSSMTVDLLEEFEALSRVGVSVAVTVMTDGGRPHLPGLRPGRVDEVFEFGVPDAVGRVALLEHFAPDIDWTEAAAHELAEGMSPAYLREWAKRVSSGSAGWLDALRSLDLQRKVAT